MLEPVRILVVDDTEANRYAVARHLRQAGYTVLEAGDGRSALALVAERSPDLLILDIRMPGLDGFEVVRRLRADTRTAHLPVLHISASFMQPGLDNHQVLEMSNFGHLDLAIEPGTAICQFVFQRTVGGDRRYEGQYKGQTPDTFWRD